MSFPEVNEQLAQSLGLDNGEYQQIKFLLGRNPNYPELYIFSAMWSEHVSLKNSIKWLKTLPTEGEHVLAEAGDENAGLVDIGDGWVAAFKIESYNHPAIHNPRVSGANAVSSTLRDIFTLGARPVAIMDSLRLGDPVNPEAKNYTEEIVKGIGDYANAFGVPVVGGETNFDDAYSRNPLLNIMAVGLVKKEHLIASAPQYNDSVLYLAGAKTIGESIQGIHFASSEITDDTVFPRQKQSNPFLGKKLMEAVLEAVENDMVDAMQELGGAGLSAAAIKMAYRGKKTMHIALDRIHGSEDVESIVDLLLSETQERMLIAVKKSRTEKFEDILRKWLVPFSHVGETDEGRHVVFTHNSEQLVELDVENLVYSGQAPQYERHYEDPAYINKYRNFTIDQIPEPADLIEVAWYLLNQPNIASKNWITNQFDATVGNNNLSINFPADAGILNLKGTNHGLMMSVDGNGRYVKADPETGAAIAVTDAARNIVCAGGKPLAITDCLNFGNPYNPEVYWQFVGAIKGITKAAEKLGTPVTGGNTSFYNQTTASDKIGTVMPTPVIGMIGLMHDNNHQMTNAFKNKGDMIFLLGDVFEDIASSEYLYSYHGIKHSPAPHFNLEQEKLLQDTIFELIQRNYIFSAHDVSDGGLFITLVEAGMPHGLGFDVTTMSEFRTDAFLFGESQGRVVVSVTPGKEARFVDFLADKGLPVLMLGHVTRGEMRVDEISYGFIADARKEYESALKNIMNI